MKQRSGIRPTGLFLMTYRNPAGLVEWTSLFRNGVTIEGVNHFGEAAFRGGSRFATWYAGLIDEAGFTSLDELDSNLLHPGWNEYTAIVGGLRVAWSPGPAAGGLIAAASPAAIQLTASGTLRGAFLSSRQAVGLAGGAVLYATGRTNTGLPVAAGGTVSVNYSVRYSPRG
jgi:hypothetical protein